MFCSDCGTKNSIDSKYCKECGAKINDGYRTMMLSLDDLRAIDDQKKQERLTKLLDMAFWHNEAGNLDASVLACEAALAVHPHSTTAHSLLGTLYEKRGNDVKAVEHLEAVVSLNPDSAADAAKLDQLRRGVHVKAVAPPPLSRWVPPALAGLTVASVKDKMSAASLPTAPLRSSRSIPLIASLSVAALFLAIGLIVVRMTTPSLPTASHQASITGPTLASSAPAVSPPAFNTAASMTGNLPPVTLPPAAQSRNSALTLGPDPFADTPGAIGKTVPLVRAGHQPAAPHAHGLPHVRNYGGKMVAALPPLSLRAVPLPGSQGLAPMPVSIPAIATVASMPQHTVVVSNLTAPAYSAPPPPQMHISIHTTSSAEHIALSDRDLPASPMPTQSDTSGAGDSEQQTAIALQQQGDYRRAAAAYSRAIRAYQAQIASGRSTDTAARALQACQTGLQICQQSH